MPFWSMNYVGRIIAEGFSGDFLKEALMNVPEDKPLEGLRSLKVVLIHTNAVLMVI